MNLTRCWACDLADDGIIVNTIAPGFINTRMALLPDGSGHEHETEWFKDIFLKYGRILLKRAGLPDDIAGAAFFLCSEDCRYVTGQVLMLEGGVSATLWALVESVTTPTMSGGHSDSGSSRRFAVPE